MPAPTAGRTYTLYAHVPFCIQLCPYCAFNRFPFDEDQARTYFRALRKEMRLVADAGFPCASLYVGGGTPTVLLDELCATIDLARELFGDLEVSCETNPDHLTQPFADALAPRVQRLSVGVQSFDDGLLRQMRRYDKYGSGEAVFDAVSGIAGRFPLLNVDLIFNFPSQTEAMLDRDPLGTARRTRCVNDIGKIIGSDTALRLAPADADTQFNLGFVREQMGKPREAIPERLAEALLASLSAGALGP